MPPSSPAEPLVSVIVPARDEARYITAALASAAAQTWPLDALEVVVVDNGSTDGTAAAVRAYMEAMPDLALCVLDEPVKGVARAKNRAARAARGRWLIFLDADSRMAPFGIRAQMFYCARETFLHLGGFDETLALAEDREFLARLAGAGIPVCHLMESWIATSPRRLRRLPWRLGMLTMLLRWALANWGIGRRWRY
jgi:glycosyltransferase involved in cell wall biosynthesis